MVAASLREGARSSACNRRQPKPTFEIRYHAGHSQSSTTEKYLRLAAVVRAGFGEVFPVLPEKLIEDAQSLVPAP